QTQRSSRVVFFNDTATTEIYTLSLHDALPISHTHTHTYTYTHTHGRDRKKRSEEHTCELQSHLNLVCRLLLEKKKEKRAHHVADSGVVQSHRLRLLPHLR